jgi:hypothetical protein
VKKGIWIKPPLEFVKINVDGSFDADDLRGTTRAIIRIIDGSLLMHPI